MSADWALPIQPFFDGYSIMLQSSQSDGTALLALWVDLGMDETYVKVRGEWTYLYRAVDKAGKTVEFHLSRKRDVNAAKTFLRKAMRNERLPVKITLDAYAASHRAVADLKDSGELPKRVQVRTSKYLNNRIEQDHRRIKQRLRPMLGFEELPKCGSGYRRHRIGCPSPIFDPLVIS